MIISEIIENGNRIHHYSDSGFRILQNETNIIYDDAVDVMPCKYTYTETTELIKVEEILEEMLDEPNFERGEK